MSNDTEKVTFVASIARVTTLADGGIRVVLDMDEHDIITAAWLMRQRACDGVVDVTVRQHEQK